MSPADQFRNTLNLDNDLDPKLFDNLLLILQVLELLKKKCILWDQLRKASKYSPSTLVVIADNPKIENVLVQLIRIGKVIWLM